MDKRKGIPHVPEHEIREALNAAEKAFDKLALEHGLNPDAEHARDRARNQDAAYPTIKASIIVKLP